MKWFSFLVVICVAIDLISPSAAFTESEKTVVIESISHINNSEKKETITFKFDASVVPNIFTIGGEKPRLVIDFPQSIYRGENVISLTGGTMASTIRIGLHQNPVKRTRVVVDLAQEMPVQYASEYSDQDNTLIVTLTPDTAKLQSNGSPDLQAQSKISLPSQEELSARPLDKKPIPPAFAVKDVAKKPAGVSIAASVVPTILEISFDQSSSKGEMVLFRLNNFSPPTVSAIEKDTPRVLCDFMEMHLGPDVQETILANGKYIERINTARLQHPDKVQIVLDLSPDLDYDLQQVFFKNDNLFVLIVNELAPKQDVQ